MKECSFRITETQLFDLGGLLATKAPNEVLICECGRGYSNFSQELVRQSWSMKKPIGMIDSNQISQHVCEKDIECCVFSNDRMQLESIAYPSSSCLWGLVEGQQLSVFKCQGHLVPVEVVIIVGHTLHYIFGTNSLLTENEQMHKRTIQAFGAGTTEYLANLTVGVAGVSGTGSIVAEQLYRLGVKRLILVDDDYVEEHNLGRIINSTMRDAQTRVNKAVMLKRVYDNVGLATEVIAAPTVIANPDTVRLLSQCDMIFGCLDSADGRMHLNRLCTFYTLPYIDLGVKLKSDSGNISEISSAIRYIIPGAASLHSIGAYTTAQVESEALRRDDPVAYRARLAEKYIQGAQESSPAVISVNMLAGSLAVLEFLNRIHEYRDISNSDVEVINLDLLEPAFLQPSAPGSADQHLSKYLGKGDCAPLLDMPGIGV